MTTNINSFRDLLVWQKSMDLAVRCYRTAQKLPKQDQMVLGYQIRKSSVSMPSNVSAVSTCTRHRLAAADSWTRRAAASSSLAQP